jgi:hypothetical protein
VSPANATPAKALQHVGEVVDVLPSIEEMPAKMRIGSKR